MGPEIFLLKPFSPSPKPLLELAEITQAHEVPPLSKFALSVMKVTLRLLEDESGRVSKGWALSYPFNIHHSYMLLYSSLSRYHSPPENRDHILILNAPGFLRLRHIHLTNVY